MVLKHLRIQNFLSIRRSLDVPIDSNVTIFLGANDHGKSNILAALLQLNSDATLGEDSTNWDAQEHGERLQLDFTLELNQKEKADLRNLLELWLNVSQASREDMDHRLVTRTLSDDQRLWLTETVLRGFDSGSDEDLATTKDGLVLAIDEIPKVGSTLVLRRERMTFQFSLNGVDFLPMPRTVESWLEDTKPRVELFQTRFSELQDSVKAEQLNTEEYEFLQGVFYYAGLDPLNCKDLFFHNDVTERRLDRASVLLDSQLKKLWAQGNDLGLCFELRHRGTGIELLANDQSVEFRKTRMSKRSSGVTQFFRISMILHARRKKHPANSYIYLFDEPGVFLHPQGQNDLQQVFERLSADAQVLYTTHSLFLLNQNFPERHRLVIRNSEGTKLDSKPYRANWRLATDALGVYLTSNIVFRSRVLLVEGDSDPLYIYELFRILNQAEHIDADANSLGIFSFSDLPNLRFLIQLFSRPAGENKLAIVVDGDDAGTTLLNRTRQVRESNDCDARQLPEHLSMEDLVLFEDQFVEAIIETIETACLAANGLIPDSLRDDVYEGWAEHQRTRTSNTGRWFNSFSTAIVGEPASKVALARNYVLKCRQAERGELDPTRIDLQLGLCRWIISVLALPSLRARETIRAQG